MSLHRVVRWRPVDGEGLEHLELRERPYGFVAQSTIIGTFEALDFGARYEIYLDSSWTFRSLVLERTDGRALTLRSDGAGHWERGNGDPLPELEGCIDIDISATPFTNTLPIRRAAFELDVPQEFRMAWVPLDTLEPFADGQIYTRRGERHFLYQAADGTFEAPLTVDSDGLVVDYSGLFTRLTAG